MYHFQRSSSSYVHRHLQSLCGALPMREVLGLPPVRNCLSFGCATGEELLTLRALFPEATLHGCDIAEPALALARPACQGLDAAIFKSDWGEVTARGPYDVILANAVFCYHHQSVTLDNLAPHLPFSLFVDATNRFTDLLRPGGILHMRDTTYPLACAPCAEAMIPLQTPAGTWSGMVEKFRPDGLKYAKRYQIGAFLSYDLLRELPCPFDEALLDAVWLKRGEASWGHRLRIKRAIKPGLDLQTVGAYLREMRLEFDPRPTLVSPTFEVRLHRAVDGTVLQSEEIRLVRNSDLATLFVENYAGVVDLESGLVTAPPAFTETSFWSQPEPGSAEWNRIDSV